MYAWIERKVAAYKYPAKHEEPCKVVSPDSEFSGEAVVGKFQYLNDCIISSKRTSPDTLIYTVITRKTWLVSRNILVITN